jgi:hypothetical protein
VPFIGRGGSSPPSDTARQTAGGITADLCVPRNACGNPRQAGIFLPSKQIFGGRWTVICERSSTLRSDGRESRLRTTTPPDLESARIKFGSLFRTARSGLKIDGGGRSLTSFLFGPCEARD